MKVQNLKLLEATADFYESTRQLCDESFGEGYIDRVEYDKWLLHPRLFNIAFVDDDYAGYSVMTPASLEDITELMGIEKSEALDITEGKPALIYKSVAVLSVYRRKGVLGELVKELLSKAKELGYGTVILSAWTYDGKTPAENSLISLGFTRLYNRQKLWYRYENYRCVICNGRCVCDAVIFYKNL